MHISGKQVSAARALIGWSQDLLAAQADVSLRTVHNAEAGKGMSPTVRDKIRTALERGGIEFVSGNGVRERDAIITTYEGEDGIIALWDDIYETIAPEPVKEILIANNGEPTEYSPRIAEYLSLHLQRLADIGAHEKIIACDGDTNLISDIATYRCVAQDDFLNAPTLIYANKVALLSWGPPAKVVILDEPAIAESLRKLFSHAWKHARTPEGGR